MKKLIAAFSLVVVTFLALPATAQDASNKKLGAQEFTGSVEVSKAPKAVWAMLTDAALSAKALSFVHEEGSKSFAKVGDSARVKLTKWNESGRFVVTYAEPGKELRISFEPDNGSYVCRDRWRLSPAGKGTKITYTQTYTESGPQGEADINRQVAGTKEKLATMKALMEGGK